MITRIVKMTFQENKADEFGEFVKTISSTIESFDGCRHLTVYRDIKHQHIFFSYSKWESEAKLDKYRSSDFFKKTWKTTKEMFAERAEAWSVKEV